MKFFILLVLILRIEVAFASPLEVYGRVAGSSKPQQLNLEQIEQLKTQSENGLPMWLCVVSELNTSKPKLHIVDTVFFKNTTSQYGLHEAYSRAMGLASSSADFIARMKAKDGKTRSLMAFTLYLTSSLKSANNNEHQWVLQNRRYIFEDSSKLFVGSLVKSQQHIYKVLPFLKGLSPYFVTYEKADSFRRPNLLTDIGRRDVELLSESGSGIVTEAELASASY